MSHQTPHRNSQEDILHPNEQRAKRQLTLAFPEVDTARVQELACVVAARRRTIDDAIAILEKEMEVRTAAANDVGTKNNKYEERRNSTSQASVTVDFEDCEITATGSPSHFQERQEAHGVPINLTSLNNEHSKFQRCNLPHTLPSVLPVAQLVAPSTVQANSAQTNQENSTHRLAAVPRSDSIRVIPGKYSRVTNSACPSRKPPRPLSLASAKAVLFMTSMTADRRVRDHCRQMETLLYLKRICYDLIDVAGKPAVQQRHREMYTSATGSTARPPLPAFFVGKNYIGDYERVQELEDEGELMEKLMDSGLIFADEK